MRSAEDSEDRQSGSAARAADAKVSGELVRAIVGMQPAPSICVIRAMVVSVV